MSAGVGQASSARSGRIALTILAFFMGFVVRAAVEIVRRRLVWAAVAVLAVALVSFGLVATAARSATGGL